MPGEKDVLRALAEDALERGVHPDREAALRDFVGDRADDDEPRDESGQGPGGESKPRDSVRDDEPREKSPTTAPETGTQKGRSGK